MVSTALRRVVLNVDCEGPTVSNDNAAEAAAEFLKNGERLFEQLSKFDDYTAYVRKRPQYNAGDTLRLLLPFLKAAGVTDQRFRRFTSAKAIRWIEGAKLAIDFAKQHKLPIFEISASYRPFTLQVAKGLGIPAENIYCTDFGLDRFDMTASEATTVLEVGAEIAGLPNLPQVTPDSTLNKLNAADRKLLETCHVLVWEKLLALPCSGRMLRQVRAMGGAEKATAVFDTIRRSDASPNDTMYIGDSITDVEAFRALRRAGGVTIVFNGNRLATNATKAAEYVAWGESSLVNALLLAVFATQGREGLNDFVRNPRRRKTVSNSHVRKLHAALDGKQWGCALSVSGAPFDTAVKQSMKFRKLTRDKAADLS